MFAGSETFVIGDDSIKRCNIYNEKEFVLAKEIKLRKFSSACWLVLMYDSKVLTIDARIISK